MIVTPHTGRVSRNRKFRQRALQRVCPPARGGWIDIPGGMPEPGSFLFFSVTGKIEIKARGCAAVQVIQVMQEVQVIHAVLRGYYFFSERYFFIGG